MSVGLLIISHDGIGSSLLGTAMQMITECPLAVKLLTVERDSEPDEMLEHTRLLLEELDSGEGVLILTDLYGSTPCNVAMACAVHENVNAVSGLNLSMLIRIMNYFDLDLSELTNKAISGGQEGVVRILTDEKNAN